MTTASDAMPRYAPERIDEVFTPLPQRLQHSVSYTHLTLPTKA